MTTFKLIDEYFLPVLFWDDFFFFLGVLLNTFGPIFLNDGLIVLGKFFDFVSLIYYWGIKLTDSLVVTFFDFLLYFIMSLFQLLFLLLLLLDQLLFEGMSVRLETFMEGIVVIDSSLLIDCPVAVVVLLSLED